MIGVTHTDVPTSVAVHVEWRFQDAFNYTVHLSGRKKVLFLNQTELSEDVFASFSLVSYRSAPLADQFS